MREIFAISGLLRKLGLKDKPISVYLSCLQLGSSQLVTNIARKAGLNRSTTYCILNDLLDRGFVSRYLHGRIQHFSALPPDSLIEFLQRRERLLHRQIEEFEALLPKFRNLTNSPYMPRPKVHYFESEEGVKVVMEDVLKSKGSVLCYRPLEKWLKSSLYRYIAEYFRRSLLDKRISLRILLHDTASAEEYLRSLYPKSIPLQFQWIPSESLGSLENEIVIYENKVAIISLSEDQMFGVIVENDEIANTQRLLFELAWKACGNL